MEKIRVGLLMGGTSAEREVSLLSGKMMREGLDTKKYEVTEIEWLSDDRFYACSPQEPKGHTWAGALEFFSSHRFDTVLLALHGKNGEDGRLQGFLEIIGQPYTGTGLLGSSVGMNKWFCKMLFRENGILTPDYFMIHKAQKTSPEQVSKKIERLFGYPVIIKPNSSGSSRGVSKVNDFSTLSQALEEAFSYDCDVMAEQFIRGVEVCGGVLGDHHSARARVLPTIEIVPTKEMYDYECKYTPGKATEFVPARIDPLADQQIRQAAHKIHDLLQCRQYSRTDFIVSTYQAYAIEINTLPGMTSTSLLPQMAAHEGIGFSALLDFLIEESIRIHQAEAVL